METSDRAENAKSIAKTLLKYAMKHLNEAGISLQSWNVGGGTVLTDVYNHRISKDIDIFIEDAQLLGLISPRLLDSGIPFDDYVEESQYTKLILPEGKIDFITAGQITSFGAVKRSFLGKKVFTSNPVEIVAKKIYFRGTDVLPRDLFDLAVLYSSDERQNLLKAMLAIPEKIKAFEKAFMAEIKKTGYKMYSQENPDMLLEGGRKIAGREFELCKDFLSDVKAFGK